MSESRSEPNFTLPPKTPLQTSVMGLVVAVLAFGMIAATTLFAVRSVMSQFDYLATQRQDIAYSQKLLIETDRLRFRVLYGMALLRIYGESRTESFLQGYRQVRDGTADVVRDIHELARSNDDRAWAEELERLCKESIASTDALVTYLQGLEGRVAADDPAFAKPVAQTVVIRDYINNWRQQHADRIDAKNLAAATESTKTERLAITMLVSGSMLSGLLTLAALRMRRRRAQLVAQLQESSQLWHGTLSSLTQGVGVYTMDGRLMYWNERFARIHQLEPDKLRVGASLEEVIRLSNRWPEFVQQRILAEAEQIAEAVRKGGTVEMTRQNHQGYVLHISARPMTADHYVVTFSDVTDLRRNERAAIDQSARLAAIMDTVVDAIITINSNGLIESWSAGAERMFGYHRDEIMGRTVASLWPEKLRARYGAAFRRVLDGMDPKQMQQRTEYTALRRDGSTFPIDLVVSELRIESRRLFVGIVRDITEQRAVEQMKNQFISTVSHELRTPLTSIAGSLGLLSTNPHAELSSQSLRLVNIAHKNSQRLTRLINDILDLERSESGQLQLSRQPLSMSALVEQAVEANRAYAAAFNVSYQVAGHDGGIKVLADSDRIMQVLTNLMSNAAKFSPAGSTVEIIVTPLDGRVRVAVQDHGSGIPDAFRPRIFTRFAQADASDTRARQGTGLGLAIVKSLIDQHGGRVDFESGTGGTTFWFELAALGQQLPATTAPRLQSAPTQVLICDSDPDSAHQIEGLLSAQGCQVRHTHSAAEVLTTLNVVKTDLLLIDLQLPDDDALSLITTIRSAEGTRDLPVILMASHAHDARSQLSVAALRVDDWLSKPLDPERLKVALQRALTQSERRPLILHVEDDESLCSVVDLTLHDQAMVIAAHSLVDARQLLAQHDFNLIILDVSLPDGSGLDLLADLRQREHQPQVVLFSVQQASQEVTAMVQAALVKSQDSLESLQRMVRKLLTQTRAARAESPTVAG